jgi:two-component system sensor histidine kinase YesM
MNWLIQLERYDELEILVDSVSTYFKRSLNAGKDFISVADTLEQLESYVQIQKIRFKNRFECIFDFDEEIIDMIIPNFILQPLLENAICHGVEPKTEKCLIQVKGIKIKERVFFTIEDDGAGISADTLKKISDFLANDKTDEDNYFALANINKRIKLYYGEEYGLTIRSTEGVGTKVTVIIPFEFN